MRSDGVLDVLRDDLTNVLAVGRGDIAEAELAESRALTVAREACAPFCGKSGGQYGSCTQAAITA
jgi:hypothetical protein